MTHSAMILWLILIILVSAHGTLHIRVGRDVRISLPNASLGLENDELLSHQCLPSGKLRKTQSMSYTPNRRLQNATLGLAEAHSLQTAYVVVLGGQDIFGLNGPINMVVAAWDSWVKYFLPAVSNHSALVLLFDERDYRKQTHSNTTEAYLDNILIRNFGARPVDCVHRSEASDKSPVDGNHSHHHAAHCSYILHLDCKYSVYSYPVNHTTFDSSTNTTTHHPTRPFLIFAAVHHFPPPAWAKNEDEEKLFTSWHLPMFPLPLYAYVKMTNWYIYHLLNLRVLDYFDYVGKIDIDVAFTQAFPEPNLAGKMASAGAQLLMTHKQFLVEPLTIVKGVKAAQMSYIEQESARCSASEFEAGGTKQLLPGGRGDPLFWEGEFQKTFKSHLMVAWLGLYQSPEVKAMAKHFNDFHPGGMWVNRWGDQEWWPRPLATFGVGQTEKEILKVWEIDEDLGWYVVHKNFPRYWTLQHVAYYDPIHGSTPESRERAYKKYAEGKVQH